MIFGGFTLLVALGISGIAAYYSIIGLTAIFSAAFWPIVIMGTALEVGKLTAASWLYQNWKYVNFWMRAYLLTAVIVIMFITSMGIFGFLSKAHLQNVAPKSEITQQTDLIDFKISIEYDKIGISRSELEILRETVRTKMAKGIGTRGGRILRDGFGKDFNRLIQEIEKSQEIIIELKTKRGIHEKKILDLEIEIGPLKYVADLIFGEENSRKFLDRTVRWVIITIIFVFDPLAVLLVIAANISFSQWNRRTKRNKASTRRRRIYSKKPPPVKGNVISTEDGKLWKEEDVLIVKSSTSDQTAS